MIVLDDYEVIREYAKRYSETGSTDTPSHGRGKRVSRKNTKYQSDSEEVSEEEDSPMAIEKVYYCFN